MPHPAVPWRRLLCAGAATALALAWQAATVERNHGGDWSAIFYTGAFSRVPPELEPEAVYRFPGNAGYDGQYYHFMAHDPWLRRGFQHYVDNPRMRYRRILAPALASLGGDDYADSLYVAVLLASVLAGAWWLSGWTASPWWGMGFLAVPATLISLDRGTVDVALAALTVGFAVCRGRARYLVLVLAPLARETGLLLIAAHALWRAHERRWAAVGWSAAAALPWLAWSGYVAVHTAPDLTSHLSVVPFGGMVYRALHPLVYATPSRWLRIAAALDYFAFAGVCAGFALALWRRRRGLLEVTALVFCAALAFVGHPEVWAEAYAFGRVASPLLIVLALIGLRDRWWWGLLPAAMVLPRILWQLGPQLGGVLRG